MQWLLKDGKSEIQWIEFRNQILLNIHSEMGKLTEFLVQLPFQVHTSDSANFSITKNKYVEVAPV